MDKNNDVPLYVLLVGINDYASAHTRDGLRPLKGAVSDAEAFKHYFQGFLGVPDDQIVLLTNSAATHSAIIDSLVALRDNRRINEGDPIFIYFAGHGTQLPVQREWEWECGGKDAMIEAIVPYDCDTVNSSTKRVVGPIIDRTMNVLLREIPLKKGNNITVVYDCCHSASGTRGDNNDDALNQESDTARAGVLAYDYYDPEALDQHIWDTSSARGSKVTPTLAYRGLESHILLAACESGKQAYEAFFRVDDINMKRGRFSTALLTLLRKESPENLRYSDILRRLDPATMEKQQPQCEGSNQNRALFNSKIIPSQRKTFTVQSVPPSWRTRPGQYLLNAGRVHKITLQSEFMLFHRDDIYFSRPVGKLSIKKIGPFSSLSTLSPHSSEMSGHEDWDFIALHTKSGRTNDLLIFILPKDAFFDIYHQLKANHQNLGNVSIVHDAANADIEIELERVSFDVGKVIFNMHAVQHPTLVDTPASTLRWSETVYVNLSNRRHWTPRFSKPLLDRSDLARVLVEVADFYRELKSVDPNPSILQGVDVDFYQLMDTEDDDLRPVEPLTNLCKNGKVFLFDDPYIPYGVKLINNTEYDLYANLFYFSNQSLAISSCAQSGSEPRFRRDVQLKSNGGTLALGWGSAGYNAYSIVMDGSYDLHIEYLKIYLSTKAIDLSHLIQPSPFSSEAARTSIVYKGIELPGGLWTDTLIPIIIRRHYNTGPSEFRR